MSPIGHRLRELREARGWTQAELAKQSGVRQGTISKLEAGTSGGTITVAERLAAALGVDAGYLLSQPTAKPKRQRKPRR